MSLETWKAEFYPVEAQDVPVEDAVRHSLQKWIGLRAENLSRHECWLDDNGCDIAVVDSSRDYLYIDSRTCALCEHHRRGGACLNCPLVKVRGRPCDDDEGFSSPYGQIYKRNPEPMIALLELALQSRKE